MKFAHIKKGMLVLLAMAIVSTLPACGRKESTPPADGGPADAQTVSVNSAVNRLAVSNDALYTIIGDELVRFRPSDRRAETVGYLSKLTGAPAEGSMLFQSDGRLWLLWAAHRDGGASGEVQLAPLNAAAGALEEPDYTLPGWPDAAAFYGEQFFFSRVTDQTDGQAALHKLDIASGEIQIVNSNSVFEIVSGQTDILYAPIKMKPLPNGQPGMFVPDAEAHSVICSYDAAQGRETPTTVGVDFPVFAEVGEQYATVHESDGKKENYELRLRDPSGETQKTFPFANAFSWPVLLSDGQHLALMTQNRTGAAVTVLDQALNVLGVWQLAEGKETELLAMDAAYVYVSQKDLPASGAPDPEQPVSIDRIEYLRKDAAPEAIFAR